MHRRGYLAMVGAAVVSGCQSGDGQSQTPTAQPTESGSNGSTATAAEEDTEDRPQTPIDTGPYAQARQTIRDGYDAYLGAAGAQTLVDVGPETLEFPTETVRSTFEDAIEQVTAASESAEADTATAERLREATGWLRSAATVQGAASDVAAGVEEAATTGNFGSGHETITGHVATALAATDRVQSNIESLSEPSDAAFGELEFVDAVAAQSKFEQFQNLAGGFETLASLFQRAVDANETIAEADQARTAGNDDEAADLAGTAAAELGAVADATGEVGPDSIQPLADWFRDAVESLEDRALAIQESTQNSSS